MIWRGLPMPNKIVSHVRQDYTISISWAEGSKSSVQPSSSWFCFEHASARHWFSDLISNPLGLSHLPIIYVHQAIFEHKLILIDAPFVVLRRWWPLLAEPNRKQGQPVVMSKFKLIESFISYTSVCTIFRGAECYHAFGTGQSYSCQVSKTLADGCFSHENRYVSSFQLLLHCPHIRNNPQSSTPRSIGNLDYVAPCSKQIRSPKPH